MVMTILEAHVEPAKSSGLEKEFTEATKKLDEGITQTLLVKSLSDPTLWRILTIWSSREALNAMRSSGETPRGVLLFRAAGAEPALSIFDVRAHSAA